MKKILLICTLLTTTISFTQVNIVTTDRFGEIVKTSNCKKMQFIYDKDTNKMHYRLDGTDGRYCMSRTPNYPHENFTPEYETFTYYPTCSSGDTKKDMDFGVTKNEVVIYHSNGDKTTYTGVGLSYKLLRFYSK